MWWCTSCGGFPIAHHGLKVVDRMCSWGKSGGGEAEFCAVEDIDVRSLCFTGGGMEIPFIPPDVAGDNACEAGSKRYHNADIVARSDMLARMARRCCDDENEQSGDDDDGDMEEYCQGEEPEVSCEKAGLPFLLSDDRLLLPCWGGVRPLGLSSEQ